MFYDGRDGGFRFWDVKAEGDGFRSRCKNGPVTKARLQRKPGLENQGLALDSVRAKNGGEGVLKGAGIDIDGK